MKSSLAFQMSVPSPVRVILPPVSVTATLVARIAAYLQINVFIPLSVQS
jgi:hypothetical protein